MCAFCNTESYNAWMLFPRSIRVLCTIQNTSGWAAKDSVFLKQEKKNVGSGQLHLTQRSKQRDAFGGLATRHKVAMPVCAHPS